MGKKFFKTILAVLMALSVTLNGMSISISANENVNEYPTYTTYSDELPGFNGMDVDEVVNGYIFANTSATSTNNIGITQINTKDFIFEGDIAFLENNTNKASLIFGAESTDYNALAKQTKKFFGLEIERRSSNNTVYLKLFQNGPKAEKLGEIFKNIAVTTVNASDTAIHVKVVYDSTATNALQIWVNDVQANFTYPTKLDAAYSGGYIGFLSYKERVQLTNVRISKLNTTYTTHLENVNGHSVSDTSSGYSFTNNNGNNIGISSVYANDFVMETDLTFTSGDKKFSFIFGAESTSYNELANQTKKFFGLEFQRTNANAIIVKFFQNGPKGEKLGELFKNITVTTVNASDATIHIKVAYDSIATNALQIWVNDVQANFTYPTQLDATYSGGYIGFLSYKTVSSVTNLKLTTDADVYTTNDIEFTGLDITKQIDGYRLFDNRGGNNTSVSDIYAKEFTFESDLAFESVKDGQAFKRATFVFGAENNDFSTIGKNKNYGLIGLEFEYKNNKVYGKVFKDGPGNVGNVFIAQVEITPLMTENCHIKVDYSSVDGLQVWVNDVKMNITAAQNTTLRGMYNGGYIGFISNRTQVYFSDISVQTYADTDVKMDDLEILTDKVTITPVFDDETYIYGMDIAGGIDEIKVRPVSDDTDVKFYYTLSNRQSANVLKEKTLVEDVITLTSDDFDTNFVTMDITAEKTFGQKTYSRTYNFRVNKWFTTEELAADPYRAQFHVSPMINFMNDPNGMVYDPTDGYWHMHFQYSPLNSMGQQSWGHVRSKDLVNWEYMPLSLQVDEIGRMYSGSAISLTEEEANRDGMLDGIFKDNKEGESRLVAFYTNAGVDGKQRQMVAYSKDHGVTWTKYNEGKPIIDNDQSISGNKFGDPKVFKIPGDDEHWYMVVIGRAQMFYSSDLINWTKIQSLEYKEGSNYTSDNIIYSECPGMNPAQVETKDGTVTKWIYSASDTFYVVGDMIKGNDGIYRWYAESDRIEPEANFYEYPNGSSAGTTGKYAGMTFYEDGTGQGRTIGVSWCREGTSVSEKVYSGHQTLPYEWKLKLREDGSYVVINEPIEEIDLLHGGIIFEDENVSVDENDENLLKGVAGLYYDLDATFTLDEANEFGFKLRTAENQEINITYNVEEEMLYVNVTKTLAYRSTGKFKNTLIPLEDGTIKLRVIVDQGIIEVFGNDGEAAISTACVTDPDKLGMQFFTDGKVTVDDIVIYEMKSMYSKQTPSEYYGEQYFMDVPEKVEVNEEFTITSLSFVSSNDKKVHFEYDDSFVTVQDNISSVKVRPTKDGTFTISLCDEEGNVLTKEDVVVYTPVFNTNIPEWDDLEGIWHTSENGYVAEGTSSGNNAIVGYSYVEKNMPFTYEADIALEGRSAALLVGIQDPDNPTAGALGFNIDRNVGICRFWQFNNGKLTDVALTAEQLAQDAYHFKLEYDGGKTFTFYLDGKKIVDWNLDNSGSTYEGGYVGLMAHYGVPTFNNVYLYTEATDTSLETLNPVYVQVNSSLEDVLKLLPETILVSQSDNIVRKESVSWDLTTLDLTKTNEYIVYGDVKNSDLTAKITVIIELDLTKLLEVANKLNELDPDDYTEESVNVVTTIIEEISELLDKSGITQENLDELTDELIAAIDALVEKSATKPSSPGTGDTTNTTALIIALLTSMYVILRRKKA